MECASCGHVFFLKQNLVKHLSRCGQPKIKYFRPGPPYECASCGKSYNLRQNLVRHMHLHQPLESEFHKRFLTERFECAVCGRMYNRRHNLLRHIRISGCVLPRSGSTNLPKKQQCIDCEKTYRSQNALERHFRTVHKKTFVPIKECDECGKTFNRKDSLKRHVLCRPHRSKFPYVICAYCYKSFEKKEKLRIHIRRLHMSEKNVGLPSDRLRCVLCRANFYKTDEVLHHIMSAHNVPLVHEHLHFASTSEFLSWKLEMQKNTTSVFVKMRQHKGEKGNVTWYKCHRSGSYRPRVSNRHRRIKLQGSMKIGGFCPAAITLFENKETGACRASYVRTHLGHNICDEAELAHMYLSCEEKNKLAGKISMGVPYNRILTDNVDVVKEDPSLDPLYLLNKQSLHNISATYRIKPPPEAPTVLEPYSDEMFVAEYHQSILFFKRAGEIHPVENCLNEEDAIVIVMTKVQEEMFRRFGNDIVTADGTFGTNDHDFVLHSFGIVDEWYEGVPVALAISNRNDQVFTDLFVRTIRQRVGNLSAKTFMSEMQTTYFDSWHAVMSAVRFQLFCKWHLDDTWRKNARKIANPEKRNEMLKRLSDLSTCLDENYFRPDFERLMADPDPDLQSFLQYFDANFVENVKSWAYCYRLDAGINSNFHLKTFDRCLKYFNGKFLQTASFTDYLSLLNDFLELETKELTRKRIFGKLSTKLAYLRRRHDEVVKNGLTMTVDNLDDPFVGWLVSVCEENEDTWSMFAIRPKKLKCSGCKLYCEECDSCLHNFECTCRDHCIEFNMCVHIHALCLYLKENGTHPNLVGNELKTESQVDLVLVKSDDLNSTCYDSSSLSKEKCKFESGDKDEFLIFDTSLDNVDEAENEVQEMQTSVIC